MRYLKNIAILLVVCMLVSVVPAAAAVISGNSGMIIALDDDAQASAEPSAAPSAEPEESAAPSEEPAESAEPSAEPSEAPAESAEPEESAAPSEEPVESAEPSNEPSASSKPGTRHNITINSAENSEVTASVKTAVKGAKVTVEAKSSRGWGLDELYYTYTQDGAEKQEILLGSKAHSITKTITMPDSDIVINSAAGELTDTEVNDDAEKQIDEVNELLTKYTSTYINNSSNYDSSDIRSMKSYIADARTDIKNLQNAVSGLQSAIDSNDLTSAYRDEVISCQVELDELTEKMESLASDMGGEEVDSFDIDISVGKGGRVAVSGLVSTTLNATSSKKDELFEDVETDGSTSLSFTITASAGYSISSFRINNKSVSYSGNKFTIRAGSIGSYVKNGLMSVSVTFGYSGFGGNTNGGGSGVYGGMTAGGGSTNTTVPNQNTGITSNDMFSDLSGAEWAREAIESLSKLGIVSGVGDGMFSPVANVTREQFAKMIDGVMGYAVDPNATTEMSDANGGWYTPYIAAAVQNGIITGRDDGTFGVGDNITRQDMAVIIYRAMGITSGEIHEFTDSAEISDYAVEAVSALYNLGVIGGYPDGSFAPKASASRAEAAKMLHSVYNRVHSN